MSTIAKTFCVIAALCCAEPAIAAPDPQVFTKQVDTFINEEMQREQVPGIAVAVLYKDRVVVAKGYGSASVESDIPVTPHTMFQSGSLGKMLTAAVVMKQVEQGKLKLDDPISKFFPDAPAIWHSITIRNLLSHTSGIPNVGPEFDFKREYTDDQLVKIAEALPLMFKPGARWSYSNTGYVLLGIIVKRATGHEYWEYLKSDIFAPLGMKTARVISDKDIVPNRASGYELVDGQLKHPDYVSVKMNTTADGSLYLSLDDWIHWVQGVNEGKVLSAASWRQIYTPIRLNSGKTYPYGFGWEIGTAGGAPRYHHGGVWQGFRTYLSRYIGDDLDIIVLTNNVSSNIDRLVDGVAKLWDPALVAAPPRPAAEPDTARRVTALIERARTGSLRQEDLSLMSPDVVSFMNSDMAKELKRLGALGELTLISKRELGDDTAYVFDARFGDRTVKISYSTGPSGAVSDFDIDE